MGERVVRTFSLWHRVSTMVSGRWQVEEKEKKRKKKGKERRGSVSMFGSGMIGGRGKSVKK